MDSEIWKDIKGYDGKYQISNYGRLWSVYSQRTLKGDIGNNGYQHYTLIAPNGKKKHEYAHRLVALMFVDNPEHLPIVNHKDENPRNNYYKNLEWCNQYYNNTYGTAHQRTAEKKSKPVAQYSLDGKLIATYKSGVEAEKITGIRRSGICSCIKGKLKTSGGFIWKYI